MDAEFTQLQYTCISHLWNENSNLLREYYASRIEWENTTFDKILGTKFYDVKRIRKYSNALNIASQNYLISKLANLTQNLFINVAPALK